MLDEVYIPIRRPSSELERLKSMQLSDDEFGKIRVNVVRLFDLVCDVASFPFYVGLSGAMWSSLHDRETAAADILARRDREGAKALLQEGVAPVVQTAVSGVESTFDVIRSDPSLSRILSESYMLTVVNLNRVVETLHVELMSALIRYRYAQLGACVGFSYEKTTKKGNLDVRYPFRNIWKEGRSPDDAVESCSNLMFEDFVRGFQHLVGHAFEEVMVDNLLEMHAKRNCIVHGGGVVDGAYLSASRRAGEHRRIGDVLVIGARELYDVTDDVAKYSAALLSAVDDQL